MKISRILARTSGIRADRGARVNAEGRRSGAVEEREEEKEMEGVPREEAIAGKPGMEGMRGVCENASERESDKMEVGAEMARRELVWS